MTLARSTEVGVVLRSSKAVTKEMMQVASYFGRSSPDPRFGPPIELRCGHLHRLLNLISISKALGSSRIASEEAPPALRAALSQQAPLGMKTG